MSDAHLSKACICEVVRELNSPKTIVRSVGLSRDGVAVSFLVGGVVHRFALDPEDAVRLAELLLSYRRRTLVHAESSSGSPTSEVSTPLEGEKV